MESFSVMMLEITSCVFHSNARTPNSIGISGVKVDSCHIAAPRIALQGNLDDTDSGSQPWEISLDAMSSWEQPDSWSLLMYVHDRIQDSIPSSTLIGWSARQVAYRLKSLRPRAQPRIELHQYVLLYPLQSSLLQEKVNHRSLVVSPEK